MDQRKTTSLTPETIDIILGECIDPMLRTARTQILDLLDDAADHLPFDLQAQLNDLLTDALSEAYRQGVRDGHGGLAALLDS